MKTCTVCHINKEDTEFGKRTSSSDGLHYRCRACNKKWRDEHRQYGTQWRAEHPGYHKRLKGTWRWFVAKRWSSLNKRTINGSNPKWNDEVAGRYLRRQVRLEFTYREFMAWCEPQKAVIEDLYHTGQIPSLDRINPDKHYSLDNLQIIPFARNCEKDAELGGNNRKGIII